MTHRVFVDGAVGTTGLEIAGRLDGRADLEIIALDDAQRKDADARREALNAADVVILCLPDDAAREAVALIDNPNTRVIDASTAHRTGAGWATTSTTHRASRATASQPRGWRAAWWPKPMWCGCRRFRWAPSSPWA